MSECYDCGELYRSFGECPKCGSSNVGLVDGIEEEIEEDDFDIDIDEDELEKDDEDFAALFEDEDDEEYEDEY